MMLEIENRIIDFYEGNLSETAAADLLRQVAESKEVALVFEDYGKVYHDLDQQAFIAPSQKLRANFDQLLLEEQQKAKGQSASRRVGMWPIKRVLAYAASVLLLVSLGLAIGFNLSKNTLNAELLALRAEMQELLKDESTSMRIKAVGLTYYQEKPDEQIVAALIETMNEDDSQNVRLAAVNALGRFAHEEDVKTALIEALQSQKNSFLQIKLINILSEIKTKQAIPSFDRLIENEETLQVVKSEAEKGKARILSI